MKKRWLLMLFASLGLLGAAVATSPTVAYALPYSSETIGPNQQITSAPDVYTPERKIVIPTESGLENTRFNSADDMCFDESSGMIYVADTANKRIVLLDKNDATYASEITKFTNAEAQEVELKNPTGIAFNHEYFLIADKGLESIIVLNKTTLDFVREIKRPDTNLIGTLSKFIPKKLCLDDRGNLYVVLEGSTKGIMQLDIQGNFVGYIGANQTQASLSARLREIFGFEDSEHLLQSGQAVTNVAIDSKGLVYTVTNHANADAIKKLNTTGNPILSPAVNEYETVQVFIDNSGNIYSVQGDGYTTVYDSYGSLLFRFGGQGDEEILGSLKNPVALSVTSERELLVLDKGNSLIYLYEPTHFAKVLLNAVDYYKDGLYLEGEEAWNEVLRYDSRFILAYRALGRANMKKGNYKLALSQFKLAEDKSGYSDAYWKIRDSWIRKNLGWVLLPIVLIVVLALVYKSLKFKKPAYVAPIENFAGRVTGVPVVRDLAYGFTFLRHPADSVYEIKYKGKGSIIGAIILYVWFAVLQILQVYLTGYLFNGTNGGVNGFRTILMSVGLLLALVLANHFVASVSNGEGKLKHTFICMIYALMPYLVLALPIFLISRALTFNESFLYYVLLIFTYGWCGINVIMTIMELHDYSLPKALLNIFLTVICLVLAIAFLFILYVLGYQLIEFLIGLFKGL